MSQKGSALTGAALTDEVLASTKSLHQTNQFGQQKGLQQHFTPETAAKLVHQVVGDHVAVLDPTAGDGSLLKFFDPAMSFGVEIDQDQIDAAEGSYKAIRGDIQHVYPLLRRASDDFGAIVCNPPFGLTWEEPSFREGKPANSTLVTLFYATQLLSHDGQIVFICGKDRFLREVADQPEAAGIYAVVEVPELFDGVQLPCVIAFGVNKELRQDEGGFITRECPAPMLDLLPQWVKEQRETALGGRYGFKVASREFGSHRKAEAWKVIQDEYERRVEKRIKKREFDVQLVGGKLIQILPSAFAHQALQKVGKHHDVTRLNNLSVNYFANSERDWNVLVGLEQSDILTIDPRAKELVDEALTEFKRIICPLYPIKPQQRLGYLSDIDVLKCKKSDPERGFVEGEVYELSTRTQTVRNTETRAVQIKSGKHAGEWEERTFETAAKVMQIRVGHFTLQDGKGDSDDIRYLVDHFELPDPGDVGTRYPEETEAKRELIRKVEAIFLENSKVWEAENNTPEDKRFKGFRKFQIEDLARMLVKGTGLLAWEQGLGKTAGGLAYIEACIIAGCQDAALVIVPKDLIPQWQRESARFTGRELDLIKTHGEANAVKRYLKRGGTGRYITYYEALSIVGTQRSEMMPEVVVEEKVDYVQKQGTGQYVHVIDEAKAKELKEKFPARADNVIVGSNFFVPEEWEEVTKAITSKELCPECHADRRSGWNGKFCKAEKVDGSQCGYSHFKHRVRPMGSMLSQAFRRGVAVIDEATMIQGDYSTRSEVIRGIRARRTLSMTGTPIKNYVPQAFWPLWWSLGNNSRLFPYGYRDKGSFEDDFAVIEWKMDKRGAKQSRKVLPEVTNLSRLWRMLSSSTIRRRKEETGEPIVKRTFHPIEVPLGVAQQRQSQKWLQSFHLLFEELYPDSNVVKAGMHELMAPMLGLQQKLDYAATIPEADPHAEWTGVPVSNWTPANLKVLELAMALAKQGRKVLIGSNLVATSRFISDNLNERGVKALHLLDGNNQTQSPEKRAKTVFAFQSDDVQVLCAGVQAIRLGHNLDAGSAVILHGLPWDFESLDQFVARVHRLTSQRNVDVYVVLPTGTLTARKNENLTLKGQAAELALDGRLIEKEEEKVDEASIVRELMEKGIPITGSEVDETDIEEAWAKVPQLEDFVIPEGLLAKEEAPAAPVDSDEPDILDALAFHGADSTQPFLAGGDHKTGEGPDDEEASATALAPAPAPSPEEALIEAIPDGLARTIEELNNPTDNTDEGEEEEEAGEDDGVYTEFQMALFGD